MPLLSTRSFPLYAEQGQLADPADRDHEQERVGRGSHDSGKDVL